MIDGLSARLIKAIPDLPMLRFLEYMLRNAFGLAANALIDRRRGIATANSPTPGQLLGRYYSFPEDVIWRGGIERRRRSFLRGLEKFNTHRAAIIDSPRIVFLLENLSSTGGVISAVQLANDLVEMGFDIGLVVRTPHEYDASLVIKCPVYWFRDDAHMREAFPDADIVVATYWPTLYRIMDLFLAKPTFYPAYFVQDFEPLFVSEGATRLRRHVEETYRLTPYCFAKTAWICEQVRGVGGQIEEVPPAVDLELFCPGPPRNPGGGKIILTMLRPSTPQRGFETSIQVLSRIAAHRDDIEIHAFGSSEEELRGYSIPFPFVNHGRVPNQEMPELYRQAYCFTEFSHFHGFGRTVAEAMACGIPCVITRSGGVSAFARDGQNCLMAAPGNTDALFEQLQHLLDAPMLRSYLAEQCPASTLLFDRKKSAEKTMTLFMKWIIGPTPK